MKPDRLEFFDVLDGIAIFSSEYGVHRLSPRSVEIRLAHRKRHGLDTTNEERAIVRLGADRPGVAGHGRD